MFRSSVRANDDAFPHAAAIFDGMRPAFTVVELLVAIVILTVGILALAATAGLVASHVGDGGRLTAAAHLARSALDSLATLDCRAVRSGAATRDGARAEWTAVPESVATGVELVVASDLRRGVRRESFALLIPCVRP